MHRFVSDFERPLGTYLYGRRMYETMLFWEKPENVAGEPPVMQDFARIWQAADKVVYSRSLKTLSSARTRLEREFDPEFVRRLKAGSPHDLSVGGPGLAAEAIRAGLVDEFRMLVTPIIVGGGKPSLPSNVRVKLQLLAEHRFRSGVVHLHYSTTT